ncbi:MAG: flagellar biosynthetic protein FliO [Bacteroidota bacterium]|nr:flagellar biosynthetic protein FliO [Bacteroidota bacterium]
MRRWAGLLLGLVGLLVLLWALLPAGGPPEPNAQEWLRGDSLARSGQRPAGSAFSWGTLLKTVLLVGALVGVLYWLKRRQPAQSPSGWMQTAAAHALPGGAHLVLVRAGDRWLLLGVTAQQVSLLAEYETSPFGYDSPEHWAGRS